MNSKTKKIFTGAMICCLAVIIAVCAVVLWIYLTANKDMLKSDAEEIAISDYGFDDITFVADGTSHTFFIEKEFGDYNFIKSHYLYYVLGEKEGEDRMLIVPSDGKASYETAWPLKASFTEIVDMVNDYMGEEVFVGPDYENVEILDSGFEWYGLEQSDLDTPFALDFSIQPRPQGNHIIAYQLGGEIVLKECHSM